MTANDGRGGSGDPGEAGGPWTPRPRAAVVPEIAPDTAGQRLAGPKIEHFIGRRAHLAALQQAVAALIDERPISMFVHGPAGMGKSALLHHFLMGLRRDEGPVVLRGRCDEGGAAPYKALGGVIDGLGRYLRRLSPQSAESLLPRDIHALARLFPALALVPAVAAAPRALEAPDAQELRQRSFSALRILLWKLAERRPLVVAIEDLQWSDVDSALLLLDLTRPPAAPPMLFLGSYRDEDRATSAPLATLLEGMGAGRPGEGDVRDLEVGPLDQVEAEELALALLFARDKDSRARADAIARAAQGSPRLIGELVRAVLAATSGPDGADGSSGAPVERALSEALKARLLRLPEQARRLLEVVAVAYGPIPAEVATRAAKLEEDERSAALTLLLADDLAVAHKGEDGDVIEPFHASIRQAIVQNLDAGQLAARHRRLARAFEASGGPDAETLSKHWLAAGDKGRAGRCAARAADQATEALAFERAARLYELALDLLSTSAEPRLSGEERRALVVRCADALVNVGKCAEAARLYASAADGADAELAFELRRRAAEQYLRSGHIDEGLELLRAVLRAVDLPFAPSPRRALASLLFHSVELRVRGLRFRERAEAEVPAEELARIDACWSVMVGLSGVDMIRSADFSARGLLLSLRAGEPYRIARALAFEASSACLIGGDARDRAVALVGALSELAERLDNPHVLGLLMMVSGMLDAFTAGRWKDAIGWYERADELLRDRCTGVTWELVTTALMASWSRYYRGQIDALARSVPAVIRGAEQRGDLYAVAILSIQAAWVGLAADNVAGARRTVTTALSRWTQSGFHLEHFVGLLAETYVDRYAGRAGAAMRRMEEAWPRVEGSLLLRLQNIRIMAHLERASTALAAAEAAPDPERLIQLALRDVKAISREKMAWSDPFVPLLRAGVAELRSDRALSAELLDEAAAGFDAADMALYAAAARRQAGELLGGERGLQRLLVADAFMAREGIRNPARWAAMLAPGFGRRGIGF